MVVGFDPLVGDGAQVLVLGTLPGTESLRAGRYYESASNGFWRLIGDASGGALPGEYGMRVVDLAARRIAIWDVLYAAKRFGAADEAIDLTTRVTNDFVPFFQAHPTIRFVCFNGKQAERDFRDLVLPTLWGKITPVWLIGLPSSSGAYALAYARKLEQWKRTFSIALGHAH